MKQKEYFGVGKIEIVRSLLNEYSAHKLFLVTGKESFVVSGAKTHLGCLIGNDVVGSFSGFSSNPKIEDVLHGLALLQGVDYDCMLAIGGGTVLDIAKMINFFSCNAIDPQGYFEERDVQFNRAKPLFAVPTTSGSGSEATHFAVMYEGKLKRSVAHPYLLPDAVIIDPGFMTSMPSHLTAVTGMDALSQAIESYWSIFSTKESKEYASEAIQIANRYLEPAVKSPSMENRSMMARAANLAGKAINITKTTACHAISYPMTAYWDIPHGHAVGLTLSSMLAYNANVSDEGIVDSRGSSFVRKTIGEIVGFLCEDSVPGAKQRIDNLMQKIGLETQLRSLGISSKKELGIVVENAFDPKRMRNNPRHLSKVSLRKLLMEIF